MTLSRPAAPGPNNSPAVATQPLPTVVQLQAIPNPAAGSVRFSYQLPKPGRVRLILYDAIGRELRTMLNQEQVAGTFELPVSLDGLPAGMYYAALQTIDQRVTERLAITK